MKIAIYQEIRSTSNPEDFAIFNAIKRHPEVTDVVMLEPKNLRIEINNTGVRFVFNDIELTKENFDYFFVRGGFTSSPTVVELVRHCRRVGIKAFDNNFSEIRYLINKRADNIKFAINDLPIPNSYIFSNLTDIQDLNLTFPLVMKTTNTGKGKNVFKVSSLEEIERILTEKDKQLQAFIFQDIIDYEHDLRVLVAGDEVLGVMKRIPKPGDFRANFSLGGTVEPFTSTPEIDALAVKAAKSCSLLISGVDVLVGKDGKLWILEANRTPGLEGISQALGGQIADRVVNFMIENAS
jgi:gamma-F420-2:alpha-L-glutamate ligase